MSDTLKAFTEALCRGQIWPDPRRVKALSKKHRTFREGILEEYGQEAVDLMDWMAGKLKGGEDD
jgi:hypothetical protein